ncbi:hypothetical protein [Lacinutrix sp. MedPE-SW]|uniref:hypothetical protein n=1 Tax=Lacinutrix sp. MedPE-SW TaxID=1860087 RepID=UPI00091F3C78|nr:hypothetical protein [Lacinutrix sp. MedPE-SW]OIQ21266.1 MAG: hypothetical protein BM549_09845 [Lacinutrix sp. MedPE-SW]
MKKVIIIAIALVTFGLNAQEKRDDRLAMKKERLSKLNAEDLAQIQTKKMVLALDLSDAQQKKVAKLNLDNAKRRIEARKDREAAKEKNEKPSQEERLKRQNEMLDHKIATKREMKSILNEAQYEKWTTMTEKRHKMGKRKKALKRRKGHRAEKRHNDKD